MPVSRRAFLAAPALLALGAAVAGCSAPPAPIEDDPDRDALEAALTVEQALLSQAGTLTGSSVAAASIIKVLTTHVRTLNQTLGHTASPSAPSSGTPTPTSSASPATTSEQLATATAHAAKQHTSASRKAGPQTAQLLASLAASDAAINVALGGTS